MRRPFSKRWLETLYSVHDAPGQPRGDFEIGQRDGRLYALIGSRWCRVTRQPGGKLVEVFDGDKVYEGVEVNRG